MVEASLFYEAESAELGFESLDDVQRVIDSLRDHPKLGQAVGRGLRRALLRRFPFSLIYSEESDQILVIAVAPPTAPSELLAWAYRQVIL